MISPIVHSSEPITLVGGGELFSGDLELALTLSSTLVAVDGGAAPILDAGLKPSAIIGDFDSLPTQARATWDAHLFHHVAEQDSTDFEKALLRVEAPAVVAVGFTGARVDHGLAVLHGLLRFAHKPCVLLGRHEVTFLAPPSVTLDLQANDTVSLFPMVPVTGRSCGLEWPIDGIGFAPGRKIGTSNRASGGEFRLEMDAPGMMTLLPRKYLRQITQALCLRRSSEDGRAQGPARWPAPGA